MLTNSFSASPPQLPTGYTYCTMGAVKMRLDEQRVQQTGQRLLSCSLWSSETQTNLCQHTETLTLEKICDGRSMNFEFRDKILSPKLNNIAVNIPFASRTPLILCSIVVLNVRYFFPLKCITEIPSQEVPSSLLRSPH